MTTPHLSPMWSIRILVATLCLGLPGCSFLDKEEPLVREQRLINESLQGNTAQFYKATKITLRSFIYLADSANHKDDLLPAPALHYFLFSLPLFAQEPASLSSLKAYAAAATEVYTLKDKLNTMQEDRYPTLLENYVYLSNPTQPLVLPITVYSSSTEHVLLMGVWMGSRKAPAEFSLYEANLFDPEQTPLFMAKVAGLLARSLVYYDNEYYYLAEQSSDHYITTVEKDQNAVPPDFLFFPQSVLTYKNEKSAYYQVHGMGMVMRGLCRRKIEKLDESLDDFEQFLSDMENAGVDNEMVWLVGSIVALQREDSEKAIAYLSKLDQSPLFTFEEKKQITLLKDYVTEQHHEKALIGIDSKVFVVKILYFYAKKNLENNKTLNALKQNKAVQQLIQFPVHLDSVYQAVAPTTAVIDSIGANVKELWK